MASYGICRIEKVKATGVQKVQYHNDREPGYHDNADIDPSRTHLNYEFVPHGKYNDEIKKRIQAAGITKKIRKDAVVLMDGMINASPEFWATASEDTRKAFFEDAFEFTKMYFGEENVFAFAVHLDETGPHAHFAAVPIKGESLAWKNFFPNGKRSLSKFQDLFFENVSKKYGLERGEVGSQRRHKSVAQLKADTQKEVTALQADIVRLEDKRDTIDAECGTLAARKEELQQDTAGIEADIATLQRRADAETDRLAPKSIAADETPELQRLDAGIEQLEAAIRAEKGNVKQLDEAIGQQESIIARLEDEIGITGSRVEQLDSELPKWREAVAAITKTVAAARERLKDLPGRIAEALEALPFNRRVNTMPKLNTFKQGFNQTKTPPVKRSRDEPSL